MSNNVVVSIITYYMTAIDYSSSWFYFVCNTPSYSRGLAVFLHNTPIEQYANSENPKETSLGCVLYQLFANRNDKTVRKWAINEIMKLIIQSTENAKI